MSRKCAGGHEFTSDDCSFEDGVWIWPCDCGEYSRDWPSPGADALTWEPIATAPHDCVIEVYAPAAHGLLACISLCQWHPDAGFCICELREPTHWRAHAAPEVD